MAIPPTVRQGLETILKGIGLVLPANRWQIGTDPTTMDDATLFTLVVLGLVALYSYYGVSTPLPPVIVTEGGPPSAQPPISDAGESAPPVSASTPVAINVGNPQPPAPGSGDQIDLSQAQIVNSPDVRGWPIQTSLSIPQVEPSIVPVFDDPGWPDVIPPGFQGPIEFTLWCFARPDGQTWIGAGYIEFWRGRPDAGHNDAGDVQHQLMENWFYITPGLAGYLPSHGEQVAFMVTAGDARLNKGPYPVEGRSNAVLVTLP